MRSIITISICNGCCWCCRYCSCFHARSNTVLRNGYGQIVVAFDDSTIRHLSTKALWRPPLSECLCRLSNELSGFRSYSLRQDAHVGTNSILGKRAVPPLYFRPVPNFVQIQADSDACLGLFHSLGIFTEQQLLHWPASRITISQERNKKKDTRTNQHVRQALMADTV